MIHILNELKQALIDNGCEDVYLAYDALPVEKKGKYFTVIALKSFETTVPVYSLTMVYIPFSAELEINVTAPEGSTMEELCNYYDEKIRDAVVKISGSSSYMSRLTLNADKKINRLVITAVMTVGGMRKISREELS